jgi:hypothetical protein
MNTSPTTDQYGELQRAFDFFNEKLFDNQLPQVMLTITDSKRFVGTYCKGLFYKGGENENRLDEICFNASSFENGGEMEILKTLVHEQCHQWQCHFGLKPPKSNHHNKEWGAKMESVGLIPSSTGKEGGDKTGRNMSEYVEKGGRFERFAEEFIKEFNLDWFARDMSRKGSAKKANKICYSHLCEVTCEEVKFWGKPEINAICGDCGERFEEKE